MLVGPSVGTPTLTTRVPDLQNVNLRGWSVRRVRVPKGQHRAQRPVHILSSPSASQVKTLCQNSKMMQNQCAETSAAQHRHEAAAPERDPSPHTRILGQRLRCPLLPRLSSRSPGRSRARRPNAHVGVMRVRAASVGGGSRRRASRVRLARASSRCRPPARKVAAGRGRKGRAGSLRLRWGSS
jgi:hypothetical protein